MKSGMSVVVGCKDRNERVKNGLLNWLQCPQVAQIVVVDWTSKYPVGDNGYPKGKVTIIRVEDQERWCLTKAYNLGFRFASHDLVCKMDSDYRVEPDFFDYLPLPPFAFWRGDWKLAQNPNDRFLNGFMIVRAEDFRAVNGYNERIVSYGYDDTDLYERLEKTGLDAMQVKPGKILHLPHEDELRLANQKGIYDRVAAIRDNQKIATQQPWGPNDKQSPFEVIGVKSNVITVKLL